MSHVTLLLFDDVVCCSVVCIHVLVGVICACMMYIYFQDMRALCLYTHPLSVSHGVLFCLRMTRFMYGNVREDEAHAEKEATFPRLLDTLSRDFSFRHTMFNKDPVKAGAARRYTLCCVIVVCSACVVCVLLF